MKILFFASASIHSVKWIKYFVRDGYDVSWLTFDNVDEQTRKELNIPIYEVARGKNKITKFLNAIRFSRKVVGEVLPDLIHVHYIGFYGFLALWQKNVPFMCTAWGSDVLINKNSLLKGGLLKRILKRSNLITCDADHMITALRDLGVSEDKIRRINFGIDTNLFSNNIDDKNTLKQKYNIPIDAPVVLSTRNHYPVYDISTIILSVERLKKRFSNIVLLIAGKGPETESLQRLVQKKQLESQVKFVGPYTVETLKEMLVLSDVYVSAALSDAGIAASTAEAMSMSLPVVISNVCENKEWVCSDRLLFAPGDASDLCEKLSSLLDDQESKEKFGKDLRQLVLDKNDYYNEMAKMDAEYNRVWAMLR